MMKKRRALFALCATAALMLAGCSAARTGDGAPAGADEDAAQPQQTQESVEAKEMTATSEGIVNGVIADAYGARGSDFASGYIPSRSLPLTVNNIPEGTAALAVSVVDPDGGDWVHWLACDIAPEGEIPENASADGYGGMTQGVNDFGTVGYGGPTPPSGTHAYVITVYALSAPLGLSEGFTLRDFSAALEGKTLASATLRGEYSK